MANLLEVKNLVTRFDITDGLMSQASARVHAVEDVSFEIKVGEQWAWLVRAVAVKQQLDAQFSASNAPLRVMSSSKVNRYWILKGETGSSSAVQSR